MRQITELQRLLRVLPALVWHRGNWNVMRPYILADDTGLADLQGVYCAGVTEPLESRQDLWDLYVDLPALSISVASAAKKDFTMTSVHKDLAGALTRAYAHGEGSNTSLVDAISEKTNGVISKLEILAEAEEGRYRYISVYMYIHPHTHICMYTYIYIYMCIYIYIYMYTCIHM